MISSTTNTNSPIIAELQRTDSANEQPRPATRTGTVRLRGVGVARPYLKGFPWENGRVPTGFWEHAENRAAYMRWLGERLGFFYIHDWYRITKRDFDGNHGGGLLALRYKSSPLATLKEYLPHVEWKEWLFRSTPQGFWKQPRNRRRYMAWLARKRDFQKTEDWYRVKKEDFHANHGGGFLSNIHNDSPIAAVQEYLPGYAWKEWLFLSVPKNFWRSPHNRFEFINWLGNRLGFQSKQDWDTASKQDFYANGGGGLLANYYGDSPQTAVEDYWANGRQNHTVLVQQSTEVHPPHAA